MTVWVFAAEVILKAHGYTNTAADWDDVDQAYKLALEALGEKS